MASIHDSYLGVGVETAYGTAVAPSRFYEMVDESIAGSYPRIDSTAYRAGQRVLHKDRFQPNPKGAAGSVDLEVLDSGFGLLFAHALGSIASGTADGNGYTTHTATVGALEGKSLTWQVGRVDNAGTIQPFTYQGGKVTDWELKNAVDGVLMLNLGLDFSKETIGPDDGAYAVATPDYPDGAQLFTFVGGSVQIAGTDFGVNDFSLKGSNALKTDRWFMATGGPSKREPVDEGNRSYTLEIKGEFEDLVQINRVASLTAAGTLASVICEWASPQGGTLTATLPFVRFEDAGGPQFDGAKVYTLDLKCQILWDGAQSPVSLAYKTKDAAP